MIPQVVLSFFASVALAFSHPSTVFAAPSHPTGSKPPISLNRADAKTLQTLPGIGKAKAQAIVVYRTKHGAFKSMEDVLKVQGIHAKLLSKLKSYVTLRK